MVRSQIDKKTRGVFPMHETTAVVSVYPEES